MIHEPKILRDGFLSLIGGQDSGLNPGLLAPTQAAWIKNGMVRGGFLETRFGYKERSYFFENTEQQAWFEDHLHQGGGFFTARDGTTMFVVAVGGRIFRIDVYNDYHVSEITPTKGTTTTAAFVSPGIGLAATIAVSDNSSIHIGYPVIIGTGRYLVTAKTATTITATNYDASPGAAVASGTPVYYMHPNASLRPRIWTLQAEEFFLIQDGSSACIIYDGSTCRRAVRAGTKQEVPTGTAMAYWQGRIWVAVNGNEIAAGDIVNGPTSIIDFTETLYLAEGGKFKVPTESGVITAMRVAPVLDASLGQGPLQVFAQKSVSTINLPVERARWKDVDSPVQPVGLIEYGALSDFGTVMVNSDGYFRAKDGLRSFFTGRRDFGAPGNVPLSREMARAMANDDERFLQYSSAVLFKNLLMFTVDPLPVRSGRSAYWRGLGILDFDLLSTMRGKSPPVWAGMWEGVNVMQILKGTFGGIERCFLFVLNADNENELWEIDPEDRFDNDGGRIVTVLESREMDFGRPLTLHKLDSAELWIDQIQGKVRFKLEYRPGQSPCWYDWGEEEVCMTARECPPEECFTWQNFQLGFKTRVGFPEPPDQYDKIDQRPSRLSYVHAARLTIEGHARIKALLVKAYEQSETENV